MKIQSIYIIKSYLFNLTTLNHFAKKVIDKYFKLAKIYKKHNSKKENEMYNKIL